MEAEPLVTVIIPTYKRPWDFLGRAVRSVLSQSYGNIELIVIDDSPADYENRDDNIARMTELTEKDPRVKLLVNDENMGGSLARNRGIDAAKGRFITFLDDDDEYLPDKIKHQAAFMEEHTCDLSFEDMKMYNMKEELVDVREYKDIESFDNDYLLHYHLMHHLTGTPTYMFRAEKLREIGGFDDAKMGQEFHLMLKSIQSGLSILYYPVCDVKIYKHPYGGLCSGKNKINGERDLYKFKKSYFSQLSAREKMYIRFRHYAVMVVAYKRSKQYLMMPVEGVLAFCASPADFVTEVPGFFKKIT